MKKAVLTIIVFATAIIALAQATQPCIVKKYNQKQQKTPLAGVRVRVDGAQTATSGTDGRFTLTFNTLKPGDHVTHPIATKPGYEIFNKAAVEPTLSARATTTAGHSGCASTLAFGYLRLSEMIPSTENFS